LVNITLFQILWIFKKRITSYPAAYFGENVYSPLVHLGIFVKFGCRSLELILFLALNSIDRFGQEFRFSCLIKGWVLGKEFVETLLGSERFAICDMKTHVFEEQILRTRFQQTHIQILQADFLVYFCCFLVNSSHAVDRHQISSFQQTSLLKRLGICILHRKVIRGLLVVFSPQGRI